MAWTEMTRVCGVGVLSLLLVGGLCGQDVPRGKALGELRDKDGKAWVGVKVILVSWPAPKNLSIGKPDTVETRTDERGRFRAQILEGRSYTVWAQGEPGADGSLRVSNVAEEVIPQVPVLLKERKETVSGRRVWIVGLEKWSDYKPLRFRLVDAAGPRMRVLQVGEDGRCQLPPVIGARATLEVVATGPHGEIRVADLSVSANMKEETEETEETEIERLRVPRPAKVTFAIWDIDADEPVEGARIYPKHADNHILVGVTDKNGWAEVVIPNKNRNSYGRFIAVADGRSVAPCQPRPSKNAKLRKLHKGKKINYHAHLGEGHKLKGRVLLGADKPASNLTLVVQGPAMHYAKKNSRTLSPCTRVFRTDSQGRFELDSLLKEYPPNLLLLLRVEHLAALPAAWQQGLSPVVFAPIKLSERMAKSTKGTSDILLTDLCPVELVVRTPMGIPAVRARVNLVSLDKSIGSRMEHPPLLTDRRGRLRLLLSGSARMGLTIDTGEAFFVSCLETQAVAGDQSIARLDLKVRAPVAIRGRVVDADDKGVAGVTLSVYPQWMARMPRLEAEVDENSEAALPTDRNGVRLTDFGKVPDHHSLFHALVGGRAAKTGKDGRFTVALPRVSLQYQLHAHVRQDGAHRRANAQVQVDAKEGAEDVELVLK